MIAPKGRTLRLLFQQFDSDGRAKRTSGGSPPHGTLLTEMLEIDAEQDGETLPMELSYDKAIWSGLSWAAGEIRASALKPDRPVRIVFSSSDPEPLRLTGRAYAVHYAS